MTTLTTSNTTLQYGAFRAATAKACAKYLPAPPLSYSRTTPCNAALAVATIQEELRSN
jgi:hypothetical protein